ncbi:MAG: 23S rRNA (adenine(2503)-C(2))-methyltransferase RlmN [Bacillota bacterium]
MHYLKGLTKSELEKVLKKQSFSAFRSGQILNWLYQNNISQPELMENLPAELQVFLKNKFIFKNLETLRKKEAEDGTIRFLWKLPDEETVETVLIPQTKAKRFTVCLSTQVGCDLGCSFCATGISGCKRNLTTSEIVDQLWQLNKYVQDNSLGEIRNVVYMGMGEPFLNYAAVQKSLKMINSEWSFNIGSRRITVSTSGIVPGIKKFARDFPQAGLAVSLHAARDSLRNKLMPINKKYPLSELKQVLIDYQSRTNRRITIEYMLIDEINDSLKEAKELVSWLGDLNVFINLLPANPVKGLQHEASSQNKITAFKKYLEKSNYPVKLRESRGQEVEAACGQLRLKEENK